MPERGSSSLRVLQTAAYVVIVAFGIWAASHVLSVLLLALLVTYSVLPFPKWLMHRFGVRKSLAIVLTVVFMVVLHVVISAALIEAGLQLREKWPVYAEHIGLLHEQIAAFLSAHGILATPVHVKSLYSYDRIVELAEVVLPRAFDLLSDRLLIAMLALIFLVESANPEGAQAGPLARNLTHYGTDVQRFIAISAQTGAINAAANLVLLVALGVDFPVVWCVLYFFLHFIPNIGFLIALVPPTLMALLMMGWKRALLVAGGLILSQILGDYVISPMLMKKGLHVSFLDMTLSLMVWGFLLGPAGAVLAIPLTLVLRKFLTGPLTEGTPAVQPSG
jgi:predicted PurR-regulated permease PerM